MNSTFIARISLASLLCLVLALAGCNEGHDLGESSTTNVPNTPANDNTDALDVLTGGADSSGGGLGGPLLNKPKDESTDDASASEESDGSDSNQENPAEETKPEMDVETSEGSTSNQ